MNRVRVNNLAYAFQEVLTVVVRVRAHQQVVSNAEVFRSQIRHTLDPVMRQARALGYTDQIVQASLFAGVALLDESILNLQDPAFADWARRPLQEELFGRHLAGETFFSNLRDYLAQSDSPQLADVLELHCLCLLLGYRGRYALGDSGEMFAMLRQARARIARIRGVSRLSPEPDRSPTLPRPGRDRWSTSLRWVACALVVVVLVVFICFRVTLASGSSSLQTISTAIL